MDRFSGGPHAKRAPNYPSDPLSPCNPCSSFAVDVAVVRSSEASRLLSFPRGPAIIHLVSIEELRSRRSEILSIATRYGVHNVRVFGSTVRGEDRTDSDVDLLVEVEQGRSLLDVIGFEQDISELLGRRVEVLTDGGLSPILERNILVEASSL